jgi:predicted GNAT family N-acyltransferase
MDNPGFQIYYDEVLDDALEFEQSMAVCRSEGKIIATCALVAREIQSTKVWYVCDVKVDPAFRGQHLTNRMIQYALLPGYGNGWYY